MNVLYLTIEDPRTRPELWSGTALRILRAVESMGHAVHVETVPKTLTDWLGKLQFHFHRGRRRIYLIETDPICNAAWRRGIQRQLGGKSFDVAVAWHPWTSLLSPAGLPRVFWYDTTFIETHSIYFPRITARSLQRGLALDRQAVHSATAVYCSDASRLSAIRNYGADPARVHTVPFGANMADAPDDTAIAAAVEARLARRNRRELRLLFVGRDWERKGGAVAVAATQRLREKGFAAALTVVGCQPDLPADQRGFVTIEGVIDKSDPAAAQRLRELYLSADYFIMASRGESFGIVYCEAFAHALPCIAADVGGVGTIVKDGQTGHLLGWSDDLPERIAAAVAGTDAAAYRAMCERCIARYRDTFNWYSAARSFDAILRTTAGRAG